MRIPKGLWLALLIASLFVASSAARAQFSGSIGLDLQSATNVQRLDTTSPDLVTMPAIMLGYQLNPSAVTQIPVSIAWLPGYYSTNSSLTYTALSLSATPSFYLSNQADIERSSAATPSPSTTPAAPTPKRAATPSPVTTEAVPTNALTNDQLVDAATTDLYALSVALDSTEIHPKGLTKARVQQLEDLRDSISEAAAVVADLLDSLGYSEATVAIVTPELTALTGPLQRLSGHTTPDTRGVIDHLNSAIAELRATSVKPAEHKNSATEDAESDDDLDELLATTAAPPSPIATLVSATTRLRDFSASDIGIRADLLDSTATTLATRLTLPLNYYTHTGRTDAITSTGNPNDSRTLSLGAALDLFSAGASALDIGYNFTHANYPFDSTYSSTESRFRLGGRFGLGESAALFGDAAMGFKNYSNPLTVVRNGVGKKSVTQQVPSSFTQFALGLGLSFFVSDDVTLGILGAVNSNPNLRAYVTDVGTTGAKKLRRAPQIADDEYTYDLVRGAAFAAFRTFWDIDADLDLSYEHRTYGEAAKRQALNQLVAGSGRTENGKYVGLALSKIVAFDERLLGIFDGISFEAEMDYANVVSSDATFSYDDLETLAGFTLSF